MDAIYQVKKGSFYPSLLVFYLERMLEFLNVFATSIEMVMWLLSFMLLIQCGATLR